MRKVFVLLVVLMSCFLGVQTAFCDPGMSVSVAEDLTDRFDYDPTLYLFIHMLYDGEREDIYLTTGAHYYCGPGVLMRYSIDTDTTESNLNDCYNPCKGYPNSCGAFSITLDTDDDMFYLGSRGTWWGGLHSFSPTTGVYSKSITGRTITHNMPWSVVYDSHGRDVYFGGVAWDAPGGDFMRYNTLTGSVTNLRPKLSLLWSGSPSLYAVQYDPASRVVYVGGVGGRLARYNTPQYLDGTNPAYPDNDTAYLIDLSSTSWGTNTIYASLVDGNGSLYIAGSNGKFAMLSQDNDGNYILADLSGFVGDTVQGGFIFDIVAGPDHLYLGASNATLVKYSPKTGEAEDISGAIAGFWGSEQVRAMAYDQKNDVLYLGGTRGKFGRLLAVTTVPALVDIDPDTLNLKSKSSRNAVTVYIEVPGLDAADIQASTVTLEWDGKTIAAQLSPTSVYDYDYDGIAELMVKFNRAEAIEMLGGASGETEITVTGEVGGTDFLGSDTIRVK